MKRDLTSQMLCDLLNAMLFLERSALKIAHLTGCNLDSLPGLNLNAAHTLYETSVTSVGLASLANHVTIQIIENIRVLTTGG